MKIDDIRARVGDRVRQAIAESDMGFTTAQREQVANMANHITNSVLLEFDVLLAEMNEGLRATDHPQPPGQPQAQNMGLPGSMQAAAQTTAGNGDEDLLWEGRPFLSIGELYTVTTERIRITTGVVGKNREDIELVRVQDVDHKQGISERLLNIGDIFLRTSDKSHPNATLRNVTNPEQVHEIIRRAVLNARKRYPFIFNQEM